MSTPTQLHDNAAETAVRSWVEKVVVGLNFCPFAKKEIERKTVRYVTFPTTQINEALSHLLEELALLDQQHEIQTTLLIFSLGFSDFDHYLDMLELANSLIAQGGYGGIYQLASFHPNYCFEGEDQSDPANYTNRSPYPILHILRENSIEAALKRYPQPNRIPENNMTKARELGSDFLQNLLKIG